MKRNAATVTSIILMVFSLHFLLESALAAPPLPSGRKEKKLLAGHHFITSEVETFESKDKTKQQKLDFFIEGLHPKTCRFALRKLSQYERYHEWLGFVKNSRYDEEKSFVYFQMESAILPFSMSLNFKIPRVKSPGEYPYTFKRGFLKDLKGIISVREWKGRCLFQTTAKWEGAHTGFSDTIFKFFSKALSKIAMQNLFRISKTY